MEGLWEDQQIEKDQQIAELARKLLDLRASNETAAMKTSALSAISEAGAINANQMLQLVQGNLTKD